MAGGPAEAHASARPPDPRYQLLERVGAVLRLGSSAEVVSWRAHDTVLRRQVRLDIHRPGGPGAERFVENALRAATDTHPTLARVLDVVNEPEHAYIVSAWVEGISLSSMLDDGPLDPPAAAALIGQLAEGVAAAHAAGTVVGVLRPDQVVRTASDTVTLLRVPLPGPTRGDDIRGIGALLYAALTARWPLDAGGDRLPPAPTPGGRLGTPRHLRAAVPGDLSALTMRALYPARPDSADLTAGELARALGACTPHGPELVPFGGREAGPQRRRRSRVLRFATPALALLALGLVAWLIASVVTAVPDQAGATRSGGALTASGTSAATSGGSTAPTPRGPAPAVAAPQPVRASSVSSYNPYNSPPGNDNSAQVGLVDDGNGQTSWHTDPYFRLPTFGGLKPGVGLLFDFGAATAVRQVQLMTPTPGISLQIRAGDTPDGTLDSYARVGSKDAMPGSATVAVTGSRSARYWLVWLTSLPAQPGGNYEGAVGEVTFLR